VHGPRHVSAAGGIVIAPVHAEEPRESIAARGSARSAAAAPPHDHDDDEDYRAERGLYYLGGKR
jgi:hypothetical protein